MDWDEINSLSNVVIGAVYEVSNTLGAGFLEKVYERALLLELCSRGILAEAQVPFQVCYKGECVGSYLADILVERALVLELKCVDRLANEHMAQCLNYLTASGLGLCLLVNFEKARAEVRRVVRNAPTT